ncbi:hypothetical protein [Marinomonas foliarum]|uniref:hypothetical protein n=1 Tax=Marinomonas foliarum TaxID=491950 RepID=UPI0015F0E9D5|nr:hypothetical protein [Marinomonas foliarum]
MKDAGIITIKDISQVSQEEQHLLVDNNENLQDRLKITLGMIGQKITTLTISR